MRLFVCSLLNAENQAHYSREMGMLIAANGRLLRAAPRESMHITYAFLQHPDEGLLEKAIDAVTVVASRHAAVDIRLGPPFVMYARNEARLVCAAVTHGAMAIERLTADIVRELQRRLPGVDVSGSRSPHVTLARFRRGTQRREAVPVEEALRRAASAGASRSEDSGSEGRGIAGHGSERPAHAARTDRVSSLQTISSELTSSGPVYVIESSIPLREVAAPQS